MTKITDIAILHQGIAIKRYLSFYYYSNFPTEDYSELVCNFCNPITDEDISLILNEIYLFWELRVTYQLEDRFINGIRKRLHPLKLYITFMTNEDSVAIYNKLTKNYSHIISNLKILQNFGPRRLQVYALHLSSKYEIFEKYLPLTNNGLVDVIMRPNQNIYLLEYESYLHALTAFNLLKLKINESLAITDELKLMENNEDDTQISIPYDYSIKALHVRNLNDVIGENELKILFQRYGNIIRIKKVRTFAFIHYEKSSEASLAMQQLNNTQIANTRIQINIAKRPFNISL